jgi:carbamoyl-phosphate synthase small subunit
MQTEVFRRVCPSEPIQYDGGDVNVLLVDVGAKDGIVECLRARGASVLRAPWHAPLAKLADGVDGIMLANGPGDPADLETFRRCPRIVRLVPGTDLRHLPQHQLLARAAGFGTASCVRSSRREDQPVREIHTDAAVTSQNHGCRGPAATSKWSRGSKT